MQCPVCLEVHRLSTVSPHGYARTLLRWSPYFDEAGVRHAHDPNRVTEAFTCSNGHTFIREIHLPCPAGDYPGIDDEKITIR